MIINELFPYTPSYSEIPFKRDGITYSPAGSIISPYFGRDPLGIPLRCLPPKKNLQTG